MNHNREREEGERDVFQWKIFNSFSSYNRNTMSATHHHIFHRIWWSEDLLCHVHSMVYSFNDSVMVNYTTPANKQTWKTFSYFFPNEWKTRDKSIRHHLRLPWHIAFYMFVIRSINGSRCCYCPIQLALTETGQGIVMVVLIRAPNGMFVVDVDSSNRDENVYDDDDDDDESSTL